MHKDSRLGGKKVPIMENVGGCGDSSKEGKADEDNSKQKVDFEKLEKVSEKEEWENLKTPSLE